ncbi:MAG: NTP transferase domain-containing protein [bacterium]|nr:NTP transferase domain-containing protein [bacterium]
MKAVILAAGKSKRCRPLTLTRPKPLLPLFFKPLITYNMRGLSEIVDGFVLVVGYMADMVREELGNEYCDLPIEYAHQKEQRGTADALTTARDYLDDDFLLLNGDDIYDLEDMQAVASAAQSAVLGVPVDDPARFGMLVADGERLIRIDEKPKETSAELANAGLFKFDMSIFEYIATLNESDRGELELVDAVSALVEREYVNVFRSESGFISVATGMDLLKAHLDLWEEVCESPGGLYVCDDAEYDQRARLQMDYAILGCGAKIGVVERLERSILFDDVTIGNGARVVESVLGEGVTVNPGVSVVGAVVGDGETIVEDLG